MNIVLTSIYKKWPYFNKKLTREMHKVKQQTSLKFYGYKIVTKIVTLITELLQFKIILSKNIEKPIDKCYNSIVIN